MGHSRSRWGIVEEEVEFVLKNMARHDMGLEELSTYQRYRGRN